MWRSARCIQFKALAQCRSNVTRKYVRSDSALGDSDLARLLKPACTSGSSANSSKSVRSPWALPFVRFTGYDEHMATGAGERKRPSPECNWRMVLSSVQRFTGMKRMASAQKNSRSSGSFKTEQAGHLPRSGYVLCVSNKKYAASLEKGKL